VPAFSRYGENPQRKGRSHEGNPVSVAAWGGQSERYPRSEDSESQDASHHASHVSTPLFDAAEYLRTPISARRVDLGSPVVIGREKPCQPSQF
jgi:hypothetical protein